MVIGLTGGIGSGKSKVATLFELVGFAVFNSDEAARDIYFDPAVKNKVTALLGADAYLSNTALNKNYIGSKIFNDAILLRKLNGIIHPAVGEEFEGFKRRNKTKHIIKETALLFEANLQNQVDKVIVVVANDALRIERVTKRDGSDREDVLKKMKSQLPQDEKIQHADWVIYNNEEEFLITQVLKICEELKVNS